MEQEQYGRNQRHIAKAHRERKHVDVEQQMTNKYNAEEKKLVPGFATTLRTRPAIINGLCQYFVDKSITIYSKRTSGYRRENSEGCTFP